MCLWGTGATVKFLKRLFGHVWLVSREFVYGVVKLRQPVSEAARFGAMRLLTPFGLFRGWDVRRNSAGCPELAALSERGFVELPLLPLERVAALKAYFCRHADAGKGRTFSDIDGYFDHYRTERIQRPAGLIATGRADCPLTQAALSDHFVNLAAEFLGLDKRHMVASASIDALIRLDQPRIVDRGYDDALEFHRDVDNFRFVKMFVFLTDVGRDGGHHEVYFHSHGRTPISLGPIARYTNEEISRAISDAQLHYVEGPAGYAFAENTFAFHRGTKPVKGDRLILNLRYMRDGFRARYPEAFGVIRGNSLLEAD